MSEAEREAIAEAVAEDWSAESSDLDDLIKGKHSERLRARLRRPRGGPRPSDPDWGKSSKQLFREALRLSREGGSPSIGLARLMDGS